MKSVYIFGPIYLFGDDYLPMYKDLNELAKKYFDKVIGTCPDFWDSKEFYRLVPTKSNGAHNLVVPK